MRNLGFVRARAGADTRQVRLDLSAFAADLSTLPHKAELKAGFSS
jgi:hypothetical protein